MVATRGHTDHLGFAPSLVYFLWLLSSQRRVLPTDKCSPVMSKTGRWRAAWLVPLLLSAPEQHKHGMHSNARLEGTSPFQLLACKTHSRDKHKQGHSNGGRGESRRKGLRKKTEKPAAGDKNWAEETIVTLELVWSFKVARVPVSTTGEEGI